MVDLHDEKSFSSHALPAVVAAMVCALGCATPERSPAATVVPAAAPSAAAPGPAPGPAPEDRPAPMPDAGSARVADAGTDGSGRRSSDTAGAPPLAPISSPCVLHAAESKRRTRTLRLPGAPAAPAAPEAVHGSCSANAECIASMGRKTAGDGFVRLDCTERACTCSLELLASARRKPTTSTFELSSPCTSSDEALALIVERCMPGMTVVRH